MKILKMRAKTDGPTDKKDILAVFVTTVAITIIVLLGLTGIVASGKLLLKVLGV